MKKTILINSILILLIVGSCYGASYFRDSGLVDIPTGKVTEHGIFNIGTFLAFDNEQGFPMDEAAVKIDFGLFDHFEAGLTAIKFEQESYILGNFKLNLISESDIRPNIALGLDNVGKKVSKDLNWKRYERAVYMSISKKFNLPYTHIFEGHIGIGNKRYVEEQIKDSIGNYLHGIFGGISKEFYPSFIRGVFLLDAEVDGRFLNLGIRYWTESGLQIDLACKALDSLIYEEQDLQFLFGLSFTNRFIMKQIDNAHKLAIQAGKLATQQAQED